MKFFVSGKIGFEADVKQAIALLENAGHEITLDWTKIAHLKPYNQNPTLSREAAILESQAAKAADVFVMLAHEKGIGMFVELGIAIGADIPIRVVTNQESSRTMFFHHPLVKRVSSIKDVISEFTN